MEQVIIVEQGRINWNGEYLPITYTPVDNQKTAAMILNAALKEYKNQPNTKVKKLKEGVYEIRIKSNFTEDEVYYLHIKTMEVITSKIAKIRIAEAAIKEVRKEWDGDIKFSVEKL